MKRVSSAKQLILDTLSRRLDKIEKNFSMAGDYQRIDPYIVDQLQGTISYEMIIYHRESQLWYDNKNIDWSMLYNFEDKFVRPDDVVFDMGCNSGFTTAWYGIAVGDGGRVYAFDPVPWNAVATELTARLNGLTNVQVFNVGLGAADAEFTMALNTMRTLPVGESGSSPLLPIRVENISRYAHLVPTVFKIDIEGAEHEISTADLSQFKGLDRMFVELHPHYILDRGIDPNTTVKNFIGQGFSCRLSRPNGGEFPEHGFKEKYENMLYFQSR